MSGVRQSMGVTRNNDTDRALDNMSDALFRLALGLRSGEFKIAEGGIWINTQDDEEGNTYVTLNSNARMQHIPKPKEPT